MEPTTKDLEELYQLVELCRPVGLDPEAGWVRRDARHGLLLTAAALGRLFESGAVGHASWPLPAILSRSIRYASRRPVYALEVLVISERGGELAEITQRLAFGEPLPTKGDR